MVELTASAHLLTPGITHDLGFSSPAATSAGSAGTGGTNGPGLTLSSADASPGLGPGGAGTGSGPGLSSAASGSGSGLGGAGQLPFTGLAVGAVTVVGAGLASAGAAVRRMVRRRAR